MKFDELYNEALDNLSDTQVFDRIMGENRPVKEVAPIVAGAARMAGRAAASAAIRKGVSKLREADGKTTTMLALQDSKIDPGLIVSTKTSHPRLKGEIAIMILHYLWETYDPDRAWMYTLFERGLLEALNNDLKGAQVTVRDDAGNKVTKAIKSFSSETSDDPDWYFELDDGTDAYWEEVGGEQGIFFRDQDVDVDRRVLSQVVDKIKRAL